MNQDRLAKVRANLRNQGLEQALLVDPLSIWWLCGYYTEPYERFLALYVPAEGTPTLFLNRLFPEAGGACEDVRTFSDTDDPVALVAQVTDHAKPLGVDKELAARWLVPLMDASCATAFSLASAAVDDARSIKDARERELMRRASASRPMLDYFTMLAQQVIHDPNSPLRNDEFYIPVMQAVLASPYYDEYERIGPAYDLAMASQNRLGQRANDFRYTLASGATGTLYGVKAEYTLLFINNPGCGMCKQLREQISGSPMLSEMIERGRLKILALYPDEDLTEWRNYRDHIPASWINAYDAGCLVRENGTYDLTAIPSLYLLDSDKRVLVKDSTDVPYIEEVIDRRG